MNSISIGAEQWVCAADGVGPWLYDIVADRSIRREEIKNSEDGCLHDG